MAENNKTVADSPKNKYYITPRQREQAERMAEKWDARSEAYYAGGDGWGVDTAGYCKTPEDAEQAQERADKIHAAINSLTGRSGTWADVQVIRSAVSERDGLDTAVTVNQELIKETLEPKGSRFKSEYDGSQYYYIRNTESNDYYSKSFGVPMRFVHEDTAIKYAAELNDSLSIDDKLPALEQPAATDRVQDINTDETSPFFSKTNTEAIIMINGYECVTVDEWINGNTSFVLGQHTEDSTFYYAQVTDEESGFKGVFTYEFSHMPTHEEVERDHNNTIANMDIDNHEAEYGADGSRVFPHLNDEPFNEEIKEAANENLLEINANRANKFIGLDKLALDICSIYTQVKNADPEKVAGVAAINTAIKRIQKIAAELLPPETVNDLGYKELYDTAADICKKHPPNITVNTPAADRAEVKTSLLEASRDLSIIADAHAGWDKSPAKTDLKKSFAEKIITGQERTADIAYNKFNTHMVLLGVGRSISDTSQYFQDYHSQNKQMHTAKQGIKEKINAAAAKIESSGVDNLPHVKSPAFAQMSH